MFIRFNQIYLIKSYKQGFENVQTMDCQRHNQAVFYARW